MFKRPPRLTKREEIEQKNAADRWWASFKSVEPKFQQALPAKREIRRPVDQRAVGPTEHQEQCAVIKWWSMAHNIYQLPAYSLFAIPNGGARDAITGSRLKAEGVRRGALDLMLAKPSKSYAGLFIEMKVGDNKPTDEQKDFIAFFNSVGYRAIVCWSADDAIAEIKNYLQGDPI